MNPRKLIAFFLSSVTIGSSAFATNTASVSKPALVFTIDDLLKRQSLSDVWFSPDGESMAFRIESGPGDQSDSEYFGSFMNGQRVFVANTRSNSRQQLRASGAALILPELKFNLWSADGEALLLMATESGNYHLAYWDRKEDRVHVLPGRPLSATFPNVKWIGRKLIYTSVSDDTLQSWSRSQTLSFLAKQWRQAWSKSGVAPTVSSANEVFKTSEPAVGSLYMCDTQTGKAEVIARGDFASVTASPDGRWVSVVRKGEVMPEALADNGQKGELLVFDLGGERPRLVATITDMDVHPGEGAWAPSGAQLLFGAKLVHEARAALRLFQLDAQTGLVTQVSGKNLRIDLPLSGGMPRMMPFGWIAGRPAAIAGAATKSGASAEQTSGLVYGREANLRFDLYLLGPDGMKNVTSAAKQGVREFVVDHQGNGLAIVDGALCLVTAMGSRIFYNPDPGSRLMGFTPPGLDERYARDYRYFFDRGVERIAVQISKNENPATIAVLDITHSRLLPAQTSPVVSFSPDLLHVVTRETDRWAEAYVYDGHKETPVAVVNEALNSRAVAATHPFTYRADGVQQKGWYVTPPNTDGSKPLPAVVLIYGGRVETDRLPPAAATTGRIDSLISGQLMAAEGYVVIYASYPLKLGKESNLMADLATQAVSAVDQLAAEQIVDPKRVAIMGHSFGGYSTAAVLTQKSDRFRAGIASAGIYNPISIYGSLSLYDLLHPDGRLSNGSINGVETGQLGLIDPPWVDPESYIRNSPFFHAEKIDTPLLILQGDLDGPVTSLEGAAQFYEALIRAGKHPTFVHYWAESHVLVSAATMRNRWEMVSTWLAHYLRHSAN